MTLALDGYVVVDLSSGISGAYCTKNLADAGAEVIKVEPPEGDPLRRWSASGSEIADGDDGALFQFLASSKRSVMADPSRPDDIAFVRMLAASADAVVWTPGTALTAHPELTPAALTTCAPHATVIAITPWGLDGPWADRPANDAVLQAMAGAPMTRGDPDRPPFIMGGRVGEWVAGMFATVGVLTSRWRTLRTGVGELVDVSAYESLVLSMTMYAVTFKTIAGHPMRANRIMNLPAIHQTKDGYVGFMVVTGQQWLDFGVMVGQPEWMEDESLIRFQNRNSRRSELVGAIDTWAEELTCDEVLELAEALRVPAAKVANGATVVDSEHYAARGFFRRNPRGGFVEPEVPYEFLGEQIERRVPEPAPRLDEHGAHYRVRTATRPVINAADGPAPAPFEGLRVADFTANWAGPIIGHVIALFGGDVIHVESPHRPDPMRYNTIRELGDDNWWEWSPLFQGPNTTKRDLTLDMSSERGRELARRLVQESDVVVENFSPRVMEGWGLGWEEVHSLNPRAIMVRAPAFGISGPWRDRTGYAQTLEMASGLAWLTGYPDASPEIPNGPMDPIAGTHATIALLLGLEHRRRTGEGVLIEAPMVRGALNVAAEQVIEYSAYDALLERNGNRHPVNAPQGVYRTADPLPDGKLDRWVMISVEDDEQWQRLTAALDEPDWATREAFRRAGGRRAAHDEIDGFLAKWCAGQSSDDVVRRLVDAGVPAAKVLLQHEPATVEQLEARGFWETVQHPLTGSNMFLGYPARLTNGPRVLNRWHAPLLGQHNREVLVDVLGLSEADVEQLESDGVIGTVPDGGGKAW